MDEIKAVMAQGKAARAEELLRNELLQECFKYLHDDYISAWKRTAVRDNEAREKLWQAVQIVGLVQDHIRKFVIDGKIASRDLSNVKYLKR
jgi:hypothetical protein